jgi:hypothetical protein
MRSIKNYNHGGVHYDLPEEKSRRELRRQKREDEKGMIPVRFRNRGQAGLDAAIAHIQRQEQKKRQKAAKKSKRKNKGISKFLTSLKAAYQARQNERNLENSASGAGSGCEKDGSCGALGKP